MQAFSSGARLSIWNGSPRGGSSSWRSRFAAAGGRRRRACAARHRYAGHGGAHRCAPQARATSARRRSVRSMLHRFGAERSAASAEACLVGSYVYHLLRDVLRAMSAAGLEFSSPDLKRHASGLTAQSIRYARGAVRDTTLALPIILFYLPCADFIRRIACITCLCVFLPRRVRHGPELSRVLSDPAITALLEAGDVDGRGVGLSCSLSSSLRHSHVNLPRHTKWFPPRSRGERILSDGYLPLRYDLLRLRVRTTGLARHEMRKLNRSFEG